MAMDEKQYRVAVVDASGIVENVVLADANFTIAGKTLIKICEVDEHGNDLVPIVTPIAAKPCIGWMLLGSDFVHPDSVPKSELELKAFLADTRYEAETSGIIWDAAPIKTTRDEQRLFSEVRLRAVQFPEELFVYKAGEGQFKKQALKKFLPLAEAVYAHVQRCFAVEALLADKIDQHEITTINQLREAFTNEMN